MEKDEVVVFSKDGVQGKGILLDSPEREDGKLTGYAKIEIGGVIVENVPYIILKDKAEFYWMFADDSMFSRLRETVAIQDEWAQSHEKWMNEAKGWKRNYFRLKEMFSEYFDDEDDDEDE